MERIPVHIQSTDRRGARDPEQLIEWLTKRQGPYKRNLS